MHTVALFAVGFLVLGPIAAALFSGGPGRKQRAWDRLKARAEAENAKR